MSGAPDAFRVAALTAGGLGLLRPAPGTWGSLPPVALGVLLLLLRVPEPILVAAVLLLGLAGAVACVRFGRFAEAHWGRSDPSSVVADEVAGQAIVVAALPWERLAASGSPAELLAWSAAALALFRILDVLKPPPIDRLQSLPHGWGVLADDLAAGAVAAAAIAAARMLL